MIDATRIEQPERKRPDLFIRLYMDESSPVDDNRFGTSWALLTMPDDAGGNWFRLPGTRREQLTKALREALAEWKMSRDRFVAQDTSINNDLLNMAEDELDAAYAALLALDAEGVKG